MRLDGQQITGQARTKSTALTGSLRESHIFSWKLWLVRHSITFGSSGLALHACLYKQTLGDTMSPGYMQLLPVLWHSWRP